MSIKVTRPASKFPTDVHKHACSTCLTEFICPVKLKMECPTCHMVEDSSHKKIEKIFMEQLQMNSTIITKKGRTPIEYYRNECACCHCVKDIRVPNPLVTTQYKCSRCTKSNKLEFCDIRTYFFDQEYYLISGGYDAVNYYLHDCTQCNAGLEVPESFDMFDCPNCKKRNKLTKNHNPKVNYELPTNKTYTEKKSNLNGLLCNKCARNPCECELPQICSICNKKVALSRVFDEKSFVVIVECLNDKCCHRQSYDLFSKKK